MVDLSAQQIRQEIRDTHLERSRQEEALETYLRRPDERGAAFASISAVEQAVAQSDLRIATLKAALPIEE